MKVSTIYCWGIGVFHILTHFGGNMNEKMRQVPFRQDGGSQDGGSIDQKSWHTPTLEIFPIDKTETDFTGGTDVGFFGS